MAWSQRKHLTAGLKRLHWYTWWWQPLREKTTQRKRLGLMSDLCDYAEEIRGVAK